MPIAEDGSFVPDSFYSVPVSRPLARAVRQFADSQSERLAAAPDSEAIVADVNTVTAGAASGGTALVTLKWNGGIVTAAGYAASYTPAVGHRVVCDYIDSQLFIAYRVIGQPLY